MSNNKVKLKLFEKSPYCHWCNIKTKLINDPKMKGTPDPLMATIDHIYSRTNILRWVKKDSTEKRNVLSCWKCNHERSVAEEKKLSKEELYRRSKGYSLNKKGKPIFKKTVKTLDEALEILKNHERYKNTTRSP